MPLRLVLDTNIWLDWLVFDDAGIAPLKAAAAAARAEIFIDDACAAELAAVLGYPLRKEILDAAAQAACMALVGNAFQLDLGDHNNLRRLLAHAADAVRRVPVLTLAYPRDYALLPDVVRRIEAEIDAEPSLPAMAMAAAR